jgi:hypothetical protein
MMVTISHPRPMYPRSGSPLPGALTPEAAAAAAAIEEGGGGLAQPLLGAAAAAAAKRDSSAGGVDDVPTPLQEIHQ